MIDIHTEVGIVEIREIFTEEVTTVIDQSGTPKLKISLGFQIDDEGDLTLSDNHQREEAVTVSPQGMTPVSCLICEYETGKKRYNVNVISMVLFQT